MSPALFAGVERGGEFAKAYGVEKNGSLWEVYPEMTSATQAASDHAAIWADTDL